MDYLLFWDDDEYPVACIKGENGEITWKKQNNITMHLKYIERADVSIGYHCGYISPIPYIDSEEIDEEILKDYIEDNHKILLFSQFTSVLKNIGKELSKNNIDYYYIDGQTNALERLNLVNKFNEGEDVKVFLISLKAGGSGLNLTSADVVIHFDPWWNPAVENQASDRAHRFGQKNVVHVIKLIAKGTIEENIIKLQENKDKLIKDFINDDLSNSGLLHSLSDKDIINLFS